MPVAAVCLGGDHRLWQTVVTPPCSSKAFAHAQFSHFAHRQLFIGFCKSACVLRGAERHLRTTWARRRILTCYDSLADTHTEKPNVKRETRRNVVILAILRARARVSTHISWSADTCCMRPNTTMCRRIFHDCKLKEKLNSLWTEGERCNSSFWFYSTF